MFESKQIFRGIFKSVFLMWLAVRIQRLNSESTFIAIEVDDSSLFGDCVDKVSGINADDIVGEVKVLLYIFSLFGFWDVLWQHLNLWR